MKKVLITGFILAISQMTFAQNTITGTVVDTEGNPMPGAKVEVAGKYGSEFVLTNQDGTFTIDAPKTNSKLRSTYVGWNTATKKGKEGVVIKMSKATWWTWSPARGSWFVGADVAMPTAKFKSFAPGLMFGYVKNFGFYVKGQFNGLINKDGIYRHPYASETLWSCETVDKYWAAIVGALIRVKGPIYLNIGAGYSQAHHYIKANNEYAECYDCNFESNVVADFGAMVRIKKFFVQAGTQMNIYVNGHNRYNYSGSTEDYFFNATIGAGIMF